MVQLNVFVTDLEESPFFLKSQLIITILLFFLLVFSQPGVAYKKSCSSTEVLIGFVNSRSSHRRCPMKIGQKFKRVSQSLFFNKVAEHLRTTASVIPSFQYTLFISHSIFYFSLEYLWSHGLSVWKLPSTCLLNPLSASGFLMICATWLINFQMVVLHEVEFCLFG